MSEAGTMLGLGWQAWLTLGVVLVMLIALARELLAPEITLVSALFILLGAGVLTPAEAMHGFANEGLLTIAAMFVVVQAVQESGGLADIVSRAIGSVRGNGAAVVRLMLPTVAISSFLNNTPVVAMLTPVVRAWATRNDIAPSKLLIPLSYASILGGMCTLIGTSTNLVVSGMMTDQGYDPIGMFELARIGVPGAILGILFMSTVGHRLLPDLRDVTEQLSEESRQYLVEMIVTPGCRLVGRSIEEGGLRHLKGLFLVHIERDGKVIGPVPPSEVLVANDRLRFTGLTATIVDLKAIRVLVPAADDSIELAPRRGGGELRLFEVVIARSSPLVGASIREAGFRNRYDAAVIAVHRAGHRIVSKIGDIVLRPGDTLLVEAAEGFALRWYNSTHFYLVSRVGEVKRIKHEKAPFVLIVLVGMVVLPALEIVPMIVSAIGAAVLLVLARVITPVSARRSIDLSVLIVIAAALGIGKAIEKTGLAGMIAGAVVDAVSWAGPVAVLLAVLAVTNVCTEIITNTATATLCFPIALAAARCVDADPRPFMLAVAIGAAASFSTPLGYQTNLIVYGPGGYRFTDFLKVGVFMNVLIVANGAFALWFWWGV